MAKPMPVPAAPSYLAADLQRRFDELAPDLTAMGVLTPLDVDVLAKYVISENEYLKASRYALRALAEGDPANADKWTAVQEKLLRQCLTAAAEFGLTPGSRRARGLFPPAR